MFRQYNRKHLFVHLTLFSFCADFCQSFSFSISLSFILWKTFQNQKSPPLTLMEDTASYLHTSFHYECHFFENFCPAFAATSRTLRFDFKHIPYQFTEATRSKSAHTYIHTCGHTPNRIRSSNTLFIHIESKHGYSINLQQTAINYMINYS